MEGSSCTNYPAVKEVYISDISDSLDAACNRPKNVTVENKEKENLESDKGVSSISRDYYEFQLYRDKKFRINKSLFTFRVAQFIWCAGGSLPDSFLGIFLKQRGLTLIELSTVFSAIFIFQFACTSVAGIIEDKIGNAKPVLLFLMFSCFFVLLLMLLTPNINSTSCISQEMSSNISDLPEYRQNFTSCYKNCSFNYKNYFSNVKNYNVRSMIGNSSLLAFEADDSEMACNSYNTIFTKTSIDYKANNCCSLCANRTKTDCITLRNPYLVAVYAALILVYYFVHSSTYIFMDFAAISVAEDNNSNVGRELAVGKSADLLLTIVIAVVLNIDKSFGPDIDFNPVISIGAGIIFCACLVSCTIRIPILPPGENVMKKALNLMRDADTLLFVLLLFITGNGYTFYLTFHLVFFETMNASSTVVALHSVAIVLYGIPLLLTSKWWCNKFGLHNIFILGLLFNAVVFGAYSYIYNPWWSLVIDVSWAFAFDLYWIAVLEYCWKVAPAGLAATYMSLAGTMQYGLGRSSGVFFGGMLMNYMGARKTFRIIAAIYFATAILYCCIFTYKKPKSITHNNGDGTAEATISKNTKNTDSPIYVIKENSYILQ